MTNAELIRAIRAEIERNRQAIRVLNEHTAPEQMSKTCAIFQYSDSILSELLSFLSTLEESKKCDGCNNVKGCVTCVNGDQWAHYEESEKPINQDELEKEIDKYREEHLFDMPAFQKVARYFAKWGADHAKGSSEIPKDLEEAADKFAVFYDQGTCDGIAQDCFIAGAKWQKEQDLAEMAQSKSPLSVAYANRCFENGKQAMKEQMLKEAVEYEVWDFSSSLETYPHINIPLDNKQYRSGDKVRVIVLPKED